MPGPQSLLWTLGEQAGSAWRAAAVQKPGECAASRERQKDEFCKEENR